MISRVLLGNKSSVVRVNRKSFYALTNLLIVTLKESLSAGISLYSAEFSTIATNNPDNSSVTGAVTSDGKNIYTISPTAKIKIFSLYPSGDLYQYPPSVVNVGEGSRDNTIEVSPDGKNVYATFASSNLVSNGLRVFFRDTATGGLTGGSTLPVGTWPSSIAVSPDGKNVYVTNWEGNSLYSFTRNLSTGNLDNSLTIIQTGGGPVSVIVSPDNLHVYVACKNSDKIFIYSRNASTGVLTQIYILDTYQPKNFVFSPDGKHLYLTSPPNRGVSLLYRDALSGSLSGVSNADFRVPIGNLTNIWNGYSTKTIAISKNGKVLRLFGDATSNYAKPVYSFNRDSTTGQLTDLSEIGINTTYPKGFII